MNTFWGETATRCMKKWYKDSKTVSHLRMLYVYIQDARAVLFILKRKGEQFDEGLDTNFARDAYVIIFISAVSHSVKVEAFAELLVSESALKCLSKDLEETN